ncbi:antitoxin Xre-like helix-turn-helix domain-containing protein [Arenimonas fontis]|uniref:DUF2384 domain-containing protein n=1 Tax=Arenimonas fontis TaxID=2608255 RepID=A0A5B2Z7N3_9GAMM|nr:antitoxin Xre-like helix-turn-helix domain-containing protein [Arenimonas fontis]KAA2284758.1 DUF2384 domain-containing protein [Arenimonas fontis]
MPHPTPHSTPDPAQVLAKAVTRAADQLELPRASLARILGLSPATVTRLYRGDYRLEPDSKAGELALLLVRLFRSLHSIVGSGDAARAWLAGENLGLNGRPRELILSAQGLVHVLDYLDAHRARL